jgi:hypothetical protein
MKFQLILSASALLLSTVPAVYADDIQDGNIESGTLLGPLGSIESGWNTHGTEVGTEVGTLLEGDGDSDAAFNNAFVAIPNPFPDNSAAFRNGRQVGIRQALNTWQRLGGTCRLAWPSYPDAINRIIQRLQNAQFTDRNQGRIAGLRQELQRRRRECNGRNPNPPNPPRPNPRNPQVCIRFGNEAARRIAWRHCNRWIAGNGRNQSWLRDCRDVAINQCKGQVATEVQNQCGMPNSRTLRQLQGQCTDKVDSMIRSSSGRGSRFTEEEMMLS